MKSIALHPDAGAEITEAVRYYESHEPGLGLDLLGEVERAFGQITEYPEACPKIGGRLRRKTLWRFPYDLIYALSPDKIRVVAFAHQKRRPFYWQKRLSSTPKWEGPTT